MRPKDLKLDAAALRALQVGTEEAAKRVVGEVNTKFLLLGLTGVASSLFERMEIDVNKLIAEVLRNQPDVKSSSPPASRNLGYYTQDSLESDPKDQQLPHSSGVTRALQYAVDIAKADHRDKASPADLLTALLTGPGEAPSILHRFGITAEKILAAVESMATFEGVCEKLCNEAGIKVNFWTLPRVLAGDRALMEQLLSFLRAAATATCNAPE